MMRSAQFDRYGRYRYSLRRRWKGSGKPVLFVMLNPSTANALTDDPTIRRCIGFARSWHYPAVEVVNLFAYRATLPEDLKNAPDPVGAENDKHLLAAAHRSGSIVLAWGIHGTIGGRDREVLKLLEKEGYELNCLGVTRQGHPRHVLYLKKSPHPVPFFRDP